MDCIQDINKILEKYIDEATKVENEYKQKISEVYDRVELFYQKYKDNIKITFKERELLEKLNKDEINKIGHEENKNSLFNKYFWSYVDAGILMRNTMIKEQKWNLIFPYLFNLSHVIELNIKMLKVKNVDGFEDIKSTHEILKMYLDKKEAIIKIGLDEKYYDVIINELTDLGNLAKEKDIAMCFKYPVKRDFETIIIDDRLKSMEPDEIILLVEKHKILLILIMCIRTLSQMSYYKNLIKRLNEFIRIIEENDSKMKKELDKRNCEEE